MSASCSDRVDPHGSQESERGPVTHCHTVSKTVGSDGSCIQHDTFWPAVHEALAVVAQDQRVFPKGQPVPHDQGHAARLMGLRHVEELWFLSQGRGSHECSLRPPLRNKNNVNILEDIM